MLAQELAAVGAPNPMAGMGTSMFGPTLLEYGTEDQKQRHIPPICRGEIRWCQGYSEPGAGSDLASLTDQVRGRRRPLEGQRPEDLDQRRPVGRLVLLPGAHRHLEEARGHQLRADRHASAGRRDPADPADRRQLAVLRDLLHRRPRREERHGRAAERRLDDRQAPAAARARAARAAAGCSAPARPCRTSRRDYVGVDEPGPAGRQRPARPDRQPRDGRPGPHPDHAARGGGGEGQLRTPAPPPRS